MIINDDTVSQETRDITTDCRRRCPQRLSRAERTEAALATLTPKAYALGRQRRSGRDQCVRRRCGSAPVHRTLQREAGGDQDTCADKGDQRRGGEAIAKRRSEEHTSELQSLMRISYAVIRLK